MINKLMIWVCIILLFLSSDVLAGGYGTISGKVIDGFGSPIEGVKVQIKEANLTADTDASGIYKINYIPGNMNISFYKNGYIHIVKPINMPEITDVNFTPITLWKYPEKGGMYIVREKRYEPINKNALFAEKDKNSLRFFVKGDPTIVANGNLTVLDYQDDNPLVMGKTLYTVHDNNLIGSIGGGNDKEMIGFAKDKYIKIVDNIGLRILELDSGKYFYSTATMTDRTRKAEGYFFEVTPQP